VTASGGLLEARGPSKTILHGVRKLAPTRPRVGAREIWKRKRDKSKECWVAKAGQGGREGLSGSTKPEISRIHSQRRGTKSRGKTDLGYPRPNKRRPRVIPFALAFSKRGKRGGKEKIGAKQKRMSPDRRRETKRDEKRCMAQLQPPHKKALEVRRREMQELSVLKKLLEEAGGHGGDDVKSLTFKVNKANGGVKASHLQRGGI